MVKSGGEVVRSINIDRISPPKIFARFLVLCEKSLGREIAVVEPESLRGKGPSLYILLPLLLTNPKLSITFRDLLLISNIFCQDLLIIKMTNILRNPFFV